MGGDMNELLEGFCQALTQILDQQTERIVGAVNKQNDDSSALDKKVEIIVSGNSLSLLDTIVKNPSIHQRLDQVSTSFQTLNTSLEEYDTILKHINSADAININLGNFADAMELLSGTDFKERLKRSSKILRKYKKELVSFFTDFAEIVNSSEIKNFAFDAQNGIKGNRGLEAYISLISLLSNDDFGKRLGKVSKRLKPEVATKIGEFFGKLNEEFSKMKDVQSAIRSVNGMVGILNAINADGFASGIWITSHILGPKTAERIGGFFVKLYTDFASMTDVSTALQKVSPLIEIIRIFATPKFSKNLKKVSEEMTEERAQVIGDFLVKLVKKFSEVAESVKAVKLTQKQFYPIQDVLDYFITSDFAKRLVIVSALSRLTSSTVVGKTIKDLIEALSTALTPENVETLRRAKKDLVTFRDVLDLLKTDIKKMLWVSVLSIVVWPIALAGMLFLRVALWGVFGVLDYIYNRINKERKTVTGSNRYVKTLKEFSKILTMLCGSLLLFSLAIAIAGLIKPSGLLAMVGVLVEMLGVLGIIYLIGKFQDKFKVDEKTAKICVLMVLISTAILLFSAAVAIAQNITPSGFVAVITVFGVLALISMISAALAWTGIAQAALLGAALIGGAMLVFTAVMLVALKVISLAASMVEDLPKLKLFIVGLVDIFSEVGGRMVLLGLAAPALALFAISTSVLLLTTAFAVGVMKLAKLVTKEDIQALKNVIQGLIDVFEMIDDYFGESSPTSLFGLELGDIPVVGTILKTVGAAGACINLVLFSLAVGTLLLVATLAIITMKLARLVGEEDRTAIRNLISSMIGVFGMINEFFDEISPTSIGGADLGAIPIVGPILKTIGAIGACINLAVFAIAVGAVMLVSILTVLTMKIARLVVDDDKTALKNVIQTMIDVFKMINDYFEDMVTIGGVDIGAVPIIGPIFKVIAGIGALAGIVMFAVGITVLLVAVALTILVSKLARSFTEEDKQNMKRAVSSMVEILSTIGEELGVFTLIAGAAKTAVLTVAFLPLIGMMALYICVLRMYQRAKNEFGGDLGAVGQNLVQDFKTFFEEFQDSFDFFDLVGVGIKSLITTTLVPMMMMLGKFVDIVAQVATMKVLIGYNKQGDPVYKQINPTAFRDAATFVSGGFSEFMTKIKVGLDGLDSKSYQIAKIMGESMTPLIDAFGNFVDIIIKLSTSSAPVEFDENGKAKKWDNINFSENGHARMAADNVTTLFLTFVNTFQDKFKSLDIISASVVNLMSQSMKPLMEGIASFTDAIVKVASYQIPIKWDSDGKPSEFKFLDSADLKKAGGTIGDAFSDFMTVLHEKLENLVKSNSFKRLIEILGTTSNGESSLSLFGFDIYSKKSGKQMSLLTLFEAVGKFASILSNFAGEKMNIVTGYDKNGKPIFMKGADDKPLTMGKDYFTKCGANIAYALTSFIETLNKIAGDSKFGDYTKKIQKNLDAAVKTFGPLEKFTKLLSKDYEFDKMKENIALFGDTFNTFFSMDLDDGATDFENGVNRITTSMDSLSDTMKKGATDISSQSQNILAGFTKLSNKFISFSNELDKTVSSIISTLGRMDYKMTESTEVSARFGDTIVEAIRSIDKALADNEDERNRRFNELTENLGKVGEAVSSLKTTIGELTTDNSFSTYITSLSDALMELKNAREALDNYKATGSLTPQPTSQTPGDQNGASAQIAPIPGTPSNATPVYIVDQNGKPVGDQNLYITLNNGYSKQILEAILSRM